MLLNKQQDTGMFKNLRRLNIFLGRRTLLFLIPLIVNFKRFPTVIDLRITGAR